METQTQEQIKHKIIMNSRCAGYLMYHGCRLIRTEPRYQDPAKNVYVFYDEEKTNHFLTKFTEEAALHGKTKTKENIGSNQG